MDVNGSPHVKCFIIKHGIKFEILEGDCKPHTSVLPDSLEVELNFTMAQMDDASVAGGAGDEEGGGLGDVSAFWKRAKRDLGSETGDQDEEGILVEDDADHSRTFKEVDEDGTLLGSLEGDVESQIEGQGNDEPDAPESDDAEFLFEGQGIDGPDAPESDDAEFPVEGQGVDGPDAPESGDSAEINESTIDEPVVETSVLSSKKAKDDVAFNDEETAENAVAEEAKIVVLDEEHESETSSDSEDDKEIDGEIDETLERDAEGDSDGWQDIEDAEAGPSVLLLSLGALGLMAFFSLFAILRRQKRKIYVMVCALFECVVRRVRLIEILCIRSSEAKKNSLLCRRIVATRITQKWIK